MAISLFLNKIGAFNLQSSFLMPMPESKEKKKKGKVIEHNYSTTEALFEGEERERKESGKTLKRSYLQHPTTQ